MLNQYILHVIESNSFSSPEGNNIEGVSRNQCQAGCVVEVADWNRIQLQIVSLQQEKYIAYQSYCEGFFPHIMNSCLLINFNTGTLHVWVVETSSKMILLVGISFCPEQLVIRFMRKMRAAFYPDLIIKCFWNLKIFMQSTKNLTPDNDHLQSVS